MSERNSKLLRTWGRKFGMLNDPAFKETVLLFASNDATAKAKFLKRMMADLGRNTTRPKVDRDLARSAR